MRGFIIFICCVLLEHTQIIYFLHLDTLMHLYTPVSCQLCSTDFAVQIVFHKPFPMLKCIMLLEFLYFLTLQQHASPWTSWFLFASSPNLKGQCQLFSSWETSLYLFGLRVGDEKRTFKYKTLNFEVYLWNSLLYSILVLSSIRMWPFKLCQRYSFLKNHFFCLLPYIENILKSRQIINRAINSFQKQF